MPLNLARGQSDRAQPPSGSASDFVPLLDHVLKPSDRNPPATNLTATVPRRWPVLPGEFGFIQVTRAAGAIFLGTVTAVVHRPATRAQAVETVAITFHVESAIRGAIPGEDLNISQWIGLWSSGQRYRVGERVLLFLYPPSKLGLTSCVFAPMGRFSVDPRGRVLMSAQHLSAFRADPVLGGKSRVNFSDFALAVQRTGEQERPQ